MTDRLFSYLLFLFTVVFTLATIAFGVFALYLATLKHAWMVEHGMIIHSYALAALSIFGEVWLLFTLRRLVIFIYEAFIIAFLRTPHESVRS